MPNWEKWLKWGRSRKVYTRPIAPLPSGVLMPNINPTPPMPTHKRPWWQRLLGSKTIWGAITMGASWLAAQLGLDISFLNDGLQLTDIGAIVGVIQVIYGRWVAKAPLADG